MRQISRAEANSLREDGAAGFYAAWANPPVLHPANIYIVQIGEDFYLTATGELTIEEAGIVLLPNGLPKQAHAVTFTNEALARMVIEETKKAKPIDLGAGVPSYHTDSLKPN